LQINAILRIKLWKNKRIGDKVMNYFRTSPIIEISIFSWGDIKIPK